MFGTRRRVALALFSVFAIAAGAAIALNRSEYSETDASWQLRGLSADGRTITIREPDRGACDDVRSSVRGADNRIEISVKLRKPREGDSVAMLVRGKNVTFRLAAPVAGRRITGQKKLDPHYRVDQNGRSDRTLISDQSLPVPTTAVPGVVGLRYGDARDALCNAGFEARPTTSHRGRVIDQGRPTRQRRTGPARPLTCTNGRLPAVPVTVAP